MIIVLDPKCLAWFGVMLCASSAAIPYMWIDANNHYKVMKQQTKGDDYDKKRFRLWLPCFGVILVMIYLTYLPFVVFPPPKFIQ